MRSILKKTEGVIDFTMDPVKSLVNITLDDKKTSVEKIIEEIRKCGFRVKERIDSTDTETPEKAQKAPLNQ
ncbi:MAG: cation transporter [Thermodesulfobacteriota bacterium]|nr:cation transporter [Thermodesulfobacteriota bacterium]